MLDLNAPVEVYFNLHKKCLSVKQKGKVVAYAESICLQDVEFKVSEAGRQRVLKEQKKNVHATVKGTIAQTNVSKLWNNESVRVGYNPYKAPTFVEKGTERPIQTAEFVELNGKNMVAYR